jgi:aminopeptidase N
MSEGFADMSASLFLQLTNKKPDAFIKFWDDERRMLLERDKEGYRAVDVGPLIMGHRVSNTKTGNTTWRHLAYPKGAYVLHMIRMMMWNPKTGDDTFKQTMHDLVATYSGKAASTEDFKAMVEKHMTLGMDLAGNGKMDWFFNEYVYGTFIPTYHFDTSFDGMMLNMKLTQSGVDENFHMPVPVYLELADGRITRLGAIPMHGNTTNDQKVDLAKVGLKERPKRVFLNYYDDVLCEKGEHGN